MPRKRRGFEAPPRRAVGNLVGRLVDELKSDRPSGQPLIDEAYAKLKALGEAARRLRAKAVDHGADVERRRAW